MSRKFVESLVVMAEATGETPSGWAWAIYRDADHSLIARSRSLYGSRRDAQEAGCNAAATVRRNLLLQAFRGSVRKSGSLFGKVELAKPCRIVRDDDAVFTPVQRRSRSRAALLPRGHRPER